MVMEKRKKKRERKSPLFSKCGAKSILLTHSGVSCGPVFNQGFEGLTEVVGDSCL